MTGKAAKSHGMSRSRASHVKKSNVKIFDTCHVRFLALHVK